MKRAGNDDRAVKFTHTDKVMFPAAGLTKGDLLDYYDRVAERLLPHLRDRPMTLERFPDGLKEGGPHFWQKNTPAYYPRWIPRVPIGTEDGKEVQYLLVNDRPTLLYLVNQGTITFHAWFSRWQTPDRPDFVLFDIDPHQSTFASAIRVAKELRAVLEEDGESGFLKTSGKTGLHVVTPWKRQEQYGAVREWARSIASRVVQRIPQIATIERRIGKRGGRVYLDVEQNAKGKHVVPPYVVRATPTATVSMPIEWKNLTARLEPKKFTIETAPKLLVRKRDTWRSLL
jgi:bifunctional non-homologous end joining protein LigD